MKKTEAALAVVEALEGLKREAGETGAQALQEALAVLLAPEDETPEDETAQKKPARRR